MAWNYRVYANRVVIFVLTFFAYSILHANRKAFGNLKPAITDTWTPTSTNQSYPRITPQGTWTRFSLFEDEQSAAVFLGVLDSIFMAAYAIGLYISGWLGDRFPHRVMLFIGLSGSACAIFLFGVVTEWAKFYNKYYYAFFWLCNGLLQSTVWPSAVAIMNIWFGNFRGFVLGVWSSSASVGNILGDLIIGAIVPYGYHYGFLVLSSMLFACSFLIIFGLIDSPSKSPSVYDVMEIDCVDDATSNDTPIDEAVVYHRSDINSAFRSEALPFFRIMCIPDVIFCSLAYACIKMVNYALFFWLTFYLTTKFGWSNSEASTFSVWYDIGGIAGSIIAGLFTDFASVYISRHNVNLLLCVAAIPTLFGYRYTDAEPKWINGLVMALVGFLIGGPATLISAVVIGDISNYPELQGARTLATVAGIIDGTGSVGAAAGQIAIPYFAYGFGWASVFYLFMASMALTVLCLVPIWVRQKYFTHETMEDEANLVTEVE